MTAKEKRNNLIAGAMLLGAGILFVSALIVAAKANNSPADKVRTKDIFGFVDDDDDLEDQLKKAVADDSPEGYLLAAKLRDRIKQLKS